MMDSYCDFRSLFSLLLFWTFAGTRVSAYQNHDPHCGGRQVIVQLFSWKWTDVAQECERFLGPKGFCGVQISPPNEHLVEVPIRPWSERYAPVSYRLTSRSGTEAELRDMVLRCKRVGVRIYADAVINHMAGIGFSGTGSAGSSFEAASRLFPGVPYSWRDFNMVGRCPNRDGNIRNYDDVNDVRNCNLGGLTDLNLGKEWVRQKIAGYLNSLIDIGVAGFRVDAAKHMWPGDLEDIYRRLHSVDGGDPFIYHEVIPGGAVQRSEYYHLGYVTEFVYGGQVRNALNNFNDLRHVVHLEWGMAPIEHALVFIDNHDNQRDGQLSFKSPVEYKLAQAFTLAFNYGFVRLMSSYNYNHRFEPPPHDGDVIKDVITTDDGSCGNGWICEHRWKPIANMVRFRNDVIHTGVRHWKVEGKVLSFSRGAAGFFAMGKGNFSVHVYTGLPSGEYCDLISECALKVIVDERGMAHVTPHRVVDPFVAITVPSKNGGNYPVPTTAAPYVTPLRSDYRRTVVMVEKQTEYGQDLFLRGGIDHERRAGCTEDATTSPCSIPIRHRQVGTSSHYRKINSWSMGDNYLDWHGAELGQGRYNGHRAHGTPMFWSTNTTHQPGYNPLNTYGPHYWIADIDMDCSRTENSYFELKAVLNGAWEKDVIGESACDGQGGGVSPYETTNHVARCGHVNVFHYGRPECVIQEF